MSFSKLFQLCSKATITNCESYQSQWRIWGMAGMARAMGATLTGAHKLLGKNKTFTLQKGWGTSLLSRAA